MHRRVLLAIVLLVLALRAPLWTMPGLGRDEATYVLWAHHPQPAYAPLLQMALGLLRLIGADAAWMWRLPSIVAGLLALLLFERWAAARGMRTPSRLLALALLAFSPWQTLTGSVLHPDDLQLVGIFAFAWAARSGRTALALVAAALTPWAKPSGLLVTFVGIAWFLQIESDPRRRAVVATSVLVGGLLPFAFLHPGMITAIGSFAQVGAQTSWIERFALLLFGVTFLSGPGALLRVLLRRWQVPRLDLQNAPDQVLAALLLAAFAWAAFVMGQVKGNWLLPGLFLAWPVQGGPVRLRWNAAVVSSVLLSMALTTGFTRPELAQQVEERWGTRIAPPYLAMAGSREAEVASATQWWHRLAEYRSLEAWCASFGAAGEIDAVVSDDYGLAAQWAVSCPTRVPALVLPHDPLLPLPSSVRAGSLVLAVRCSIEDLVGSEGWEPLEPIPHPITGAPVLRAVLNTTIEMGTRAAIPPSRSP